jgi:type II secretory pathway component GspD/PulD (secretin)
MIYYLQHFGGTTVNSSRDSGTKRRSVTVKTADLNPIVTLARQRLGNKSQASPLPTENALVIDCETGVKDEIIRFVAGVDQPKRQVEITARIFEAGSDFDFQMGARTLLEHMDSNETHSLASTFNTNEFLDFLADQAAGSTAGFQGGVMTLVRAWNAAGVTLQATFEALVNTGQIREVASPRMTVAAGETGYMLAGQELPIQSANISNSSFQATTTYKPVGVQLYITPRTIGADSVKLHVVTIVSATSGFAPLPTLSGLQSSQLLVNPIIDSREAETSVTVHEGSTLVIGGLRMIRTQTRENKIPGLGDIPIFEWLFKNHRSQKQTTDLFFFVTPRLVQ